MTIKRSSEYRHAPLNAVANEEPTASTTAITEAAGRTAGPSGKAVVSAPSPARRTPRTGKSREVARENKAPQTGADEPVGIDLDSPEYYLNRELTWLAFNRRVLHEAGDERTPLLERLKFLAIAASNLDEFFMKRIGGLKQLVGAGVRKATVDGRSPGQQIEECYAVIRKFEGEIENLLPEVLAELKNHGITILSYQALTKDEQRKMREHYIENIFPLVTPQAIDSAHPFPFISNLSLNLLVSLSYTADDDEEARARVKAPIGPDIPRFLPVGDSKRFVALEQVMSHNLDLLFPKMDVRACELFQVTRNANTDHDEERADDLLAMIETELRERRFAPIVRVQVERNMDSFHRGMLAADFGLDERTDVFYVDDGMLAKRHLMEIAMLPDQELHYPVHYSVDHPKLDSPKIFYAIRDQGPILVQHPYESFSSSVERFLLEAGSDPKVRAIKMTLYRTSGETRIVDYLIEAAQNGKQVAVVVEIKARFDEAANIRWASRMEEAGIHVTYGVVGLKTHCKLILVVRRDYSGLRLYAHIGTGNYHSGTARLYDDLGLLTCDEDIGRDLIELFNYLTTGYTPKRNYRKILPAPKVLKQALIAKIRREIALHSSAQPGHIQMKMNALEDPDITRELYLASQAGVRVDLIVRDTCRLRPGIPGLSDNIRIISIVGRFLEHSRIYYFHNGGDHEYYIGSADSMMRNLEHRVEVLIPVEDTALQAELYQILNLHLDDQRNAWDMHSDGTYVQRRQGGENGAGCQEQLIAAAQRRHMGATRLKRRKPKVIVRRNVRLPSA
ncbi:MAG: polyphosphate kinase 1 [Nitrococcus sp.]|nr:polyphosphate kinase 1 [Nitrococcus sp.]